LYVRRKNDFTLRYTTGGVFIPGVKGKRNKVAVQKKLGCFRAKRRGSGAMSKGKKKGTKERPGCGREIRERTPEALSKWTQYADGGERGKKEKEGTARPEGKKRVL